MVPKRGDQGLTPGIGQPLTIRSCKPNTKFPANNSRKIATNFQISKRQESLQELQEIVKFAYEIPEQGTTTFLDNEQLRDRSRTDLATPTTQQETRTEFGNFKSCTSQLGGRQRAEIFFFVNKR